MSKQPAHQLSENTRIGFLGLGTMGRVMARRLVDCGYDVTVWNRSSGAAQELAEFGATVATSVADALSAPVVVSILSDDNAIREQLVDSGVLPEANCRVHINMATVSTDFAAELDRLHTDCGIAYIAAPVLGRATVAADGKLQVLAAGPSEALESVQDILNIFAARVWNLGKSVQTANAAKIAVNFMIATAIESIAEASALGEAYDLDRSTLIELITTSVLPGPVYAGYGGLIARQEYRPAGFAAKLGLKDVRLAQNAASSRTVPLPLGGVVHDSLLQALAHGHGDADWAVMGEVARQRSGMNSEVST
ncbi:Putative oxidoreductase [Mycobacteroides abscessus subsp. bolletii]|uniref:NAD(P)-dependent oxidoreductase n=1 Tax=Mycobacteroides abscessus TaxID=36809 RepID=UPI0009A8007C|nr:NAD(P)-dependent oxidoreductase [Mycobacteroides abscessus]SKG72123.1 Putative oxidoreductase [Mycobacteroides abscessus subsp. bolletii]SKH10617.1 Putative oxidoreductase [Mycobacteroides abscessus subsp. bolletii]